MTEERKTGFWYAAAATAVAGLVTAGFLFAALAFVLQERQAAFRADAGHHERTMEGQLLRLLDAMGQAMTFHQTIPRGGSDDFRLFSRQIMRRFPFVGGMAFAVALEGADRAAYEEGRREEGMPTFAIRDRSGERFAVASGRESYMPLQFAEPFGPDVAVLLGLDLAQTEGFREALRLAATAGKPMLVRLPGLFSEWHEFWMMQAVYRGRDLPEAEAERLARLGGVLMVRVEPEKAIARELERLGNIEFTLLALSSDGKPMSIVAHRDARKAHERASPMRMLTQEDTVAVGGVDLQFRFRRDLRYADLMGPPVWLALGAAGVVSLFLALLTREHLRRRRAFAALDEHRAQLEILVEQRTAELKRQNERLEESARFDREARSQVEAAQKELQESNQELQQFAYAVSHDLQEPLRTVTNYMQMLERRFSDTLGDDGREFIGFAADASRRMQSMIRDLLEYSRIQTRAGDLRPVDLDKVLAEVERNLGMSIDEAGAKLTVNRPLPILVADETQLVRLFQNLIGNAIKYRPTDRTPEIEVRAEQMGHEWRFSLSDNGIGIDPKYFGRIFGVFTRLHTREEYPGTGIGLALCKRIVERHGGKISVTSEPGRGSTFTFTLQSNA
ncbi:MAG: ATP-binding protein [Magnetospirillum sp. WYHS-4]